MGADDSKVVKLRHDGAPPRGTPTIDDETPFRLLVDSVARLRDLRPRPQGHVATWNDGAERIKGYTADEIIGRHFSTFYPERTCSPASASAS